MLQEKRMSFGEHLEELRARILYSLGFAAVMIIVALIFQGTLMNAVLGPHKKAFRGLQLRWGFDGLAREIDAIRVPYERLEGLPATDRAWWEILRSEIQLRDASRQMEQAWGPWKDWILSLQEIRTEKRQEGARLFEQGMVRTIIELRNALSVSGGAFDLAELRSRLKKAAASVRAVAEKAPFRRGWIAPALAKDLIALDALFARRAAELPAAAAPVEVSKEVRADLDAIGLSLEKIGEWCRKIRAGVQPVVALSYMERFIAHLKIAFLMGLLASVPFALYQMWLFIGAGLYPHEQKYVKIFLPFSLLQFTLGILFGYFVLIPFGLQYLGGYGSSELMQTMPNLTQYMSLFLTLTLVLGVIFEMPLIMVFLAKIGVPISAFRKYRRYAIVLAFMLGAMLTPPDPVTQIFMAGPLIALYELGILAAVLFGRGKAGGRRAGGEGPAPRAEA